MALDSNTQFLDTAKKILAPETISSILSVSGITHYALLILDRWALNSPQELQQLEKHQGALGIEMLLLQQQKAEKTALETPSALEARSQGMSDWEILAQAEIDTQLQTTR